MVNAVSGTRFGMNTEGELNVGKQALCPTNTLPTHHAWMAINGGVHLTLFPTDKPKGTRWELNDGLDQPPPPSAV
jgi:hypothetical protein